MCGDSRHKFFIMHKSLGMVASFLDEAFRNKCFALVNGFDSCFYTEDEKGG